jgi:hypothetical protein
MSVDRMLSLKYLIGYPDHVQARVRELIEADRLGRVSSLNYLADYPDPAQTRR